MLGLQNAAGRAGVDAGTPKAEAAAPGTVDPGAKAAVPGVVDPGVTNMLELAETLADHIAMQVRYQKVSLVGAGPGDAGLFTRRGLECVRRADVIVYDNLISGSILNEARLDAELFMRENVLVTII